MLTDENSNLRLSERTVALTDENSNQSTLVSVSFAL